MHIYNLTLKCKLNKTDRLASGDKETFLFRVITSLNNGSLNKQDPENMKKWVQNGDIIEYHHYYVFIITYAGNVKNFVYEILEKCQPDFDN